MYNSVAVLPSGQSDGSSSQTRANSDIVVDLQITADDRSNSVTCTITSSDDGNRYVITLVSLTSSSTMHGQAEHCCWNCIHSCIAAEMC